MGQDNPFESLLLEGTDLFQKRNYQGARKKFAQAMLRRPGSTEARFWVGVCHYHGGNIMEARKQLERVLDEGKPPLPERPAAVYEYLARCFISADTKHSIILCEEGIRRDPHDPRIRLILGNAYLRMDQNEDGLRHYDTAWEIEGGREGKPAFPAHPGQVPFSRSAALVELKRWKEAYEAVGDALYRDPDNALYHNRKSVILYDGLHRPEEAVAAVERAIELDPETVGTGNDGIYYYNLAHYLEKLNRNGKALEAIDRAIAISPQRSFKEYRKKLLNVAQKETSAEPPASPKINFSRVGGMKALKEQVRRIVNVIHKNREDAERYGIVRNGILLYGPPGCGKSFFAEAIAGEFSLNFTRIELGSALSKYVGSAGETMEKLFQKARESVPCVLFLDELDTLAEETEGASGADLKGLCTAAGRNAFLRSLEEEGGEPAVTLADFGSAVQQLFPESAWQNEERKIGFS